MGVGLAIWKLQHFVLDNPYIKADFWRMHFQCLFANIYVWV